MPPRPAQIEAPSDGGSDEQSAVCIVLKSNSCVWRTQQRCSTQVDGISIGLRSGPAETDEPKACRRVARELVSKCVRWSEACRGVSTST